MKHCAKTHLLVIFSLISLTGMSTAPLVADTVVVVTTGDSAPDGNGVFDVLGGPMLNASGHVAFLGHLTDTNGGSDDDIGIYLGLPDTFPSPNVIRIAREGQALPDGNGTFAGFGSAALNASDQAAFFAILTGTSGGSNDDEGIFLGSTGLITQVARAGQAAPDGNGRFIGFGAPTLNSSGQTAFRAYLARTSGGSTDNDGIFLGSGGPVTQVARTGQAALDPNTTFAAFGDTPTLNGSGQVAFTALLTGASDYLGIFLGSGGPITQVARIGQVGPDGNGTFSSFGAGLGADHQLALNGSGQVAFRASLTGTSNYEGIFLGSGGPITLVARTEQAAPDGNGTFRSFRGALAGEFDELALNDAGQVAFGASLAGTNESEGIFLGAGEGPIMQVARTGQAAPDTRGTFHSFNKLALNASGQVAFEAFLTGSSSDYGIFLGNGIDVIPIVRKGDSWAGSLAIDGLFLGGLNDQGQISFSASMSNGPFYAVAIGHYTLQTDIHWTAPGNGHWTTISNWANRTVPNSFHHAFIKPATGGTVTGPAAPLFVDSLTIGSQTSGVAELILQNELATFHGVTIEDRGRLTLSGQTISDVTLLGGGRIGGYGLILGSLGGTTGQAGVEGSGGNYHHAGPLDLGSRDATVASLGFADLGTRTTFGGGTIYVPNGLAIGLASSLEGNGTVRGKIAAGFGSTIVATGPLSVGDSNAFDGFFSDGVLRINNHSVTLNDRNKAVLGSLTELGSGGADGTLGAPNGILLEDGKTLAGQGDINTANDEFKNQGYVHGEGTGITFNDPVTGHGDFGGTITFNAAYSPGNSPAVVSFDGDLVLGSSALLQIELGGHAPGSEHDQILVAGTLNLGGAALQLDWLPSGGSSTFGGEYTVATYATRVGQFDSIGGGDGPYSIGEAYVAGIDYVTDDQIAVALHTLLDGDADIDGDVDFGDYLILEAAFGGPGQWKDADFDFNGVVDFGDYLILEAAFGDSVPAESAAMNIPEPGTFVMLWVALAGTLSWYRRKR